MSQTFQCGDNTALVGYMYGECEAGAHDEIKAHVEVCAACAAELAALESTRVHLASWTPPEVDLGFQVVRPDASGFRPHPSTIARSALSEVEQTSDLGPRASGWGLGPGPWYRQPLPGWAQAAAASAIFAAGLALGIARGTMPAADPVTSAPAATTAALPAAADVVSGRDLAALEQRLRADIAQLRITAPSGAAGPQTASEAQLLARVRTLIEESEQRQQRELALRTTQVMRDFDSQRRVDLAQIQHSFGQIEGVTGAQAREQQEMLNYLMRVSQSGR